VRGGAGPAQAKIATIGSALRSSDAPNSSRLHGQSGDRQSEFRWPQRTVSARSGVYRYAWLRHSFRRRR
jgi:hypothetical protein